MAAASTCDAADSQPARRSAVRAVPVARRVLHRVSVTLICAASALSCAEAPADGGSSGADTRASAAVLEDGPRKQLDLSGAGWRLALDPDPEWPAQVPRPPPVDLSTLPRHAPPGGWDALDALPLHAPGGDLGGTEALAAGAFAVSVPETVEGALGARLAAARARGEWSAAESGLDTDHVGVSWWWRDFELPAEWLAPDSAGHPRRLELRFAAVRLAAEVFVNGLLVGYDAVGNTPFAVDATVALRPGVNRLALRITDPGGNFDWVDWDAHFWGEASIPPSHGFGGISGPVRLFSLPAVHVADVYVASEGEPRQVRVTVEFENTTGSERVVALRGEIGEISAVGAVGGGISDTVTGPPRLHFERRMLRLPPGRSSDTLTLALPGARLWSPAEPVLHRLQLELAQEPEGSSSLTVHAPEIDLTLPDFPEPVSDRFSQRFGLRWFELQGVGTDAVPRLNGQRVFLASAISWGFWPGNGLWPVPELARRQVVVARELGLNMLNHHRTLAAPGLLDLHDELGLLAYEEPGGYAARGGDATCRAFAREKLLRMVRRDRNHPSLVIVNLINEETAPPTDEMRRDLADAHALAPHLLITYTSGWADEPDAQSAAPLESPAKLHRRPGADTDHESGWWDRHNAPGPGVWRDEFHLGADETLRSSRHRREVVFWGEDGAIAAPPRLDLAASELRAAAAAGAAPGWDGPTYLAWADGWQQWLAARDWPQLLPELLDSIGDVALDYHARVLLGVRTGDVGDGYVVNGWESGILENHSGIVDVFRRVKGRPATLAAATAPTALSVRLRASVAHMGEWVSPAVRTLLATAADIALVDETGLSGPVTLKLSLHDKGGRQLWSRQQSLSVPPDGRFGRVLAADVAITADCDPGRHELRAELLDAAGRRLAAGRDELWVVDWRNRALPAHGALLERTRAVRNFFARQQRPEPQIYHPALERVPFVLLGEFDPEPRDTVPASAFAPPPGSPPGAAGLRARFAEGADFDEQRVLAERFDAELDFEWSRSDPAPGVPRTRYVVQWDGLLLAAETGLHVLRTWSDDGARLWLDDELLIDHWESHAPAWAEAEVRLDPARPARLRLQYRQETGEATLRLAWTRPEQRARMDALAADLLRRVAEDGTTLCVLAHADRWAAVFQRAGALRFEGSLVHGRYWLGGGFFARSHPLLSGLPAEGALGVPWQSVVHYGMRRSGLHLPEAETVIGCWSDHQVQPATALGVLSHGRGRILFCTLDVLSVLNDPPGPADVARRLFVNVLAWAGAR